MDWAAKELEKCRRELDMALGDVEAEERRRQGEEGMGRQLLKYRITALICNYSYNYTSIFNYSM